MVFLDALQTLQGDTVDKSQLPQTFIVGQSPIPPALCTNFVSILCSIDTTRIWYILMRFYVGIVVAAAAVGIFHFLRLFGSSDAFVLCCLWESQQNKCPQRWNRATKKFGFNLNLVNWPFLHSLDVRIQLYRIRRVHWVCLLTTNTVNAKQTYSSFTHHEYQNNAC